MNKTTEALNMAEEALETDVQWGFVNKNVLSRRLTALAAIREALAEQPTVLEDPHPPHRLCECTACLEYWTPLPDCDAFAASGKPIAEHDDLDWITPEAVFEAKLKAHGIPNPTTDPVKQEPVAWASIEALAVERYKVVPSHDSMFYRYAVVAGDGKQQLYIGREVECENMARKFAGAFLDGAFFMSDAAPVQPVKQEPVAYKYEYPDGWTTQLRFDGSKPLSVVPLYAAPVRTKDLTDDEIYTLYSEPCSDREMIDFARAVIAAFKEKNK